MSNNVNRFMDGWRENKLSSIYKPSAEYPDIRLGIPTSFCVKWLHQYLKHNKYWSYSKKIFIYFWSFHASNFFLEHYNEVNNILNTLYVIFKIYTINVGFES